MVAIYSEGEDNLKRAEGYYSAMLAKDFDEMAGYLHDDIILISPLAEISGKAEVVSAAKNLSQILRSIQIRSKFSAQEQIMFAYDFTFDAPIGVLRAAVLMDFTNQLISRIELFYDARQFTVKSNEIFRSKSN